MAIRGRKPTATVIKLQTGTFRTDRHDESEPKPEGSPDKPPKLRGRASQLWDVILLVTGLGPSHDVVAGKVVAGPRTSATPAAATCSRSRGRAESARA
jgi:hypothetical protein